MRRFGRRFAFFRNISEVSVNSNRNRSTIVYVLLFAIIIVLVMYNLQSNPGSQETLSINQVAADVKSGIVARIIENDSQLTVVYQDGGEGN